MFKLHENIFPPLHVLPSTDICIITSLEVLWFRFTEYIFARAAWKLHMRGHSLLLQHSNTQY